MSNPSPLLPLFEKAEALFMSWGDAVQIVSEFASLEIEYATIRKAAALMDCAHRGLLKLTGADRADFLHRMVSNNIKDLPPAPGMPRRAFILTAKGRILADLLIVHDAQYTLIDLDVHQAGPVAEELDKLLFGEDVRIENLSQSHHRLSLHGPKAPQAAEHLEGLDGYRFNYAETGEAGCHLWAPVDQITTALLDDDRFKPIGWGAFNIARIEAGRPMFNIDFGPDSLPHETGVLDETVSFTKGCYRGQEIVARMQSLGHPAKKLVGFRAEGSLLPLAGTNILDSEGAQASTVGAVTSSTYAPMLSQTPIGFAMVKWGHHEDGAKLFAPAEGVNVPITVHPLQFYHRG